MAIQIFSGRRIFKFSALALFLFSSTFIRAAVSVDFVKGSGAENAWSDPEKQLVQKAADIAFERLTRMHIMNCIARETHPGKYLLVEKTSSGKLTRRSLTKDEFKKTWGSQTGFLNKFKKFAIRIEKSTLDGREIGKGRVSIAVADRANYELLNLEVRIDINKMLNYQRHFTEFKEDQLNLWINTLVHEISHNLGYSHNSGDNWKEAYDGFVPTVAGICAASDGKYYKFSG